MREDTDEILLPSLPAIKKLLEPILIRLEKIEFSLNDKKATDIKFYRNEDLKKVFGISNNTIIKYRENGILPYTKLGDIFLYDIKKIEKILAKNHS